MPEHSWTKFIEAKRKELQRLNNAYKNTLSNAKVELLQGFGKIVDPHTVDVDGKKYTVSMGVPALRCWFLNMALSLSAATAGPAGALLQRCIRRLHERQQAPLRRAPTSVYDCA
jgi:hypothetical protein